MAECRYYAMCDACDLAGDDWLPCNGTDDGTVCGHFEPMPDVKALLELVDELERPMRDGGYSKRIARRIREALGVQDG